MTVYTGMEVALRTSLVTRLSLRSGNGLIAAFKKHASGVAASWVGQNSRMQDAACSTGL